MSWIPQGTKDTWNAMSEKERNDVIVIIVGLTLTVTGLTMAFGLPALFISLGLFLFIVGLQK
jgi:hypothetical protein